LLLGVLDLRDEESKARALDRRDAGETSFGPGLLAAVEENQRDPDLTRLYTVLSAESVAPEHLGHAHFQERYRHVREVFALASEAAQQQGELRDDVDVEQLAILFAAVMDGLQIQFLLEPDAVDMVGPFKQFLDLVSASSRISEPPSRR